MSASPPHFLPRCLGTLILIVAAAASPGSIFAAVPDLGSYDIDGGLVVFVDPADASDAIALAQDGRYLVAILADDPADEQAHDDALDAAGVYPVAEAHRWLLTDRLPLRTNSANVVILPESRQGLLPEAKRVIAPGQGLVLYRDGGSWQSRRKDRPATMGEWLGETRDGGASNYSEDDLVDAINSVHFFAGGARQRDTQPFYASSDTWIMKSHRDTQARDPFSGVVRWQKRLRGSSGFMSDEHYWTIDHDDGKLTLYSVHMRTGADGPTIELGAGDEYKNQDNAAFTQFFRMATDGSVIYAANGIHRLAAYEAATGNLLWEKQYPDLFVECLAISDGLLVGLLSHTNNEPYESTFSWNTNVGAAVVGLDPTDGDELWRNDACDGRPVNNLSLDGEKVVVCSFLFNRGQNEYNQNPDADWYEPKQFLQVIERDSGATRFLRTDFTDVRGSNSKQYVALWPAHVGVMKDNAMTLFSAADGSIIEHYFGPGYHLCQPAVNPNRFYTGNASVPMSDPSVIDMHGHDLAHPQYNHRGTIANGMLYSPNNLTTAKAETTLGGAAAMIWRDPSDWQSLDLSDAERLLTAGTADWSEPTADDWPSFRGDASRLAWRTGAEFIPDTLTWSVQVPRQISGAAAGLLRVGWQLNIERPGVISQPVADKDQIIVALPDEHRLIAYDRATGFQNWSIRLSGRVSTAPTLAGGVGYIGSADGTVSAIDLDDGSLIWRFLAAPAADLIFDHEQLTSVYQIPSALVLHDGALWVSAGRHASMEHGIIVWKLDPSNGSVLGRTAIDSSYLGADDRQPQVPSESGGTKDAKLRIRAIRNDILQVRRDQVVLGNTAIDPSTLAVDLHQHDPAFIDVHPQRDGINGGAPWISPEDMFRGYHVDHVSFKANHYTHSDGMILNRELGIIAMIRKRGEITIVPDGFLGEEGGKDFLNDNTVALATDQMDQYRALAGRGNLIYLAYVGWDKKLHLMIMDYQDPGTSLRDIAVERLEDELFIPDGIAVTGNSVVCTTTAGRILVFGNDGEQQPQRQVRMDHHNATVQWHHSDDEGERQPADSATLFQELPAYRHHRFVPTDPAALAEPDSNG